MNLDDVKGLDRLSLNASTTVLTSGTPFTVDVISASGAEFLLNNILLIGTVTGGATVLQTIITLDSGAPPTATAETVPSTVAINPATLVLGGTYELQVEYATNFGEEIPQSATLTGLLVTTAAAGAGLKIVSTSSGVSVTDNTPAAVPPAFGPMPTLALTSISTSPSPTTATSFGGAVIATGAGSIIASGSSGSSDSSALSTGAKAGIAVGVVALVLVLVIAALFAWRAGRKRKSGAAALELVPNAEMMPYTHNRDPDRDLTAEKEMNMHGYAPGFHHVDTGFSDASSTAAAAASGGVFGHAHASPTESSPVAAGLGGNVGPVPQQQYMQPSAEPQYVQPGVEPLPDSPYVSPVYEQPPIHSQHSSALLSAGQFGSQLASLHEPGMSGEELARLADEERRLDEAIAEAERRRGSDA